MNNYEFISYKQYPEDQYTAASCKIRIDKKYVFIFVQKKMKDGGLFWAAPSVSVTDSGEKKYLSAHMLDSQMESEDLIDFIKDNVKRVTAPQTPMSGSLQQAGGFAQSAPSSMKEVAVDEPLPF